MKKDIISVLLFVLGTICTLDVLFSFICLMLGFMTESNILLAWAFNINPLLFLLIKGLSYIPALFYISKHRNIRNRHFIISVLLFALVVYFYGFFGLGRF